MNEYIVPPLWMLPLPTEFAEPIPKRICPTLPIIEALKLVRERPHAVDGDCWCGQVHLAMADISLAELRAVYLEMKRREIMAQLDSVELKRRVAADPDYVSLDARRRELVNHRDETNIAITAVVDAIEMVYDRHATAMLAEP